jgi:hypothetical protein
MLRCDSKKKSLVSGVNDAENHHSTRAAPKAIAFEAALVDAGRSVASVLQDRIATRARKYAAFCYAWNFAGQRHDFH